MKHQLQSNDFLKNEINKLKKTTKKNNSGLLSLVCVQCFIFYLF